MDKSFNDQELSDIMKEIEALEEGFQAEEEAAVAAEAEAEQIDSDVVEELAHMSESVSIPKTNKSDAQIHQFSKPLAPITSTSNHTSMSFKVQGDLNLELFFDVGGKTVAIEVTEAGLAIQMEGGVTFTVPVNSPIKKAI